MNPYFFASINPGPSPIRFQPGEVRVFAPASSSTIDFKQFESVKNRTIPMVPVENPSQNIFRGGMSVPTSNPGQGSSRVMSQNETVDFRMKTNANTEFSFGMALEDATRAKLPNPGDSDRGQAYSDVQTKNFSKSGTQEGALTALPPKTYSFAALKNPNPTEVYAVLETYQKVAKDSGARSPSDLVFTINPRQASINSYLSVKQNGLPTERFLAGPNYETITRTAPANINNVIDLANGGRNAYYGESNGFAEGKTHLSFFEAPRSVPLSLAAFQHADLSGTAFATANQFANSWASPYLSADVAAVRISQFASPTTGGPRAASFVREEMPVYDYSYLANESMWDSFFFSGAASKVQPASLGSGSPAVWASDTGVASITKSHLEVLEDFIRNPQESPLQNGRMRLDAGEQSPEELIQTLSTPEGCVKIAGHLMVDGAFNINSTSVKAWKALLSGMKNLSFELTPDPMNSSTQSPHAGSTSNVAFPRLRNPMGERNNNWLGFRELTDAQIDSLAQNIVTQVKKRGPFLSLGEFVNRRVDGSDFNKKGLLQQSIDATNINEDSQYIEFDVSKYPEEGQANISPNKTGVGIPGYLTQADVLQSIAPVITPRSDTFTIRAYGDAKDATGNTLARAYCEAVVQRGTEFVDAADEAHTAISALTQTNQTFGRKYRIIHFRYLAPGEI